MKVITGPQLLWHWWKDAEPAVWVTDGTTACVLLQRLKKILTAFPSSCSLGCMKHKATRDGAELPRSYCYFGEFVKWKVVEWTANTWSFTSRITSPSRPHWRVFSYIQNAVWTPNYADETKALLVLEVSPDLFRKNTSYNYESKMKLNNGLSFNSVYTGTLMEPQYESSACGNDHTTTGLVKAPNDGTKKTHRLTESNKSPSCFCGSG